MSTPQLNTVTSVPTTAQVIGQVLIYLIEFSFLAFCVYQCGGCR